MRLKPILAACLLTVLVAACGGTDQGSGSGAGGSPASSSAPPEDSASEAASATPIATGDTPSQDAESTPADQGTDAQAQTENYYGQPAPPAEPQDDPQAEWKSQRADNDTPAG